ncbi:DNA polymerase III subunit chi [Methylophaga sp.]|jgi:DNA polymerase-3 subunit chi|uniref:DNA polymerase III subunit chi n=1 Tax=Methylophaga sp. TaxID=2024840 RepID=UPI001401AF1C|nr:DNA polymerase III subunit chi [Methylophaga sp.]MTI62349.1 DNA polymerase III subunit chi [Methylophaga sp.]
MTRISFYVLKSIEPEQRQAFACRLAEKVYHQGQQVYIHTENAAQSAALNDALWAIRPDSFVPHEEIVPNADNNSPVLIGHNEATPPRLMDVLINLTDQQPLFFSQFERVAEIIDDNAPVKQAGRERFQFYKQRGYELDTFHI